MKDAILTFGRAALELGTTYAVVSGLAKAHGLTPKPVPHNGNAKGLDAGDMAVLRRALGLKRGQSLKNRQAVSAS